MTNQFEYTQIEQLRQVNPRYLQFMAGIAGVAIAGSLLNNEAASCYKDAQKVLAEQAENERRPKPPKLPRRPNARTRTGGILLEST